MKISTTELETVLSRELMTPKGITAEENRKHISEAVEFVQNRLRKATIKTQVIVACDYLSQYGYCSRYTPSRMDGK